jgi:NTE family protein
MNIQEIKYVVSSTPPFDKLNEQELDEFIGLCEVKEYKNGQYIYKIDDPADYFYLLLQGRVVALTKEDQRELEIELLKRGVSFGIISLFNDEPHSVTTRAIESSTLIRVEKEKFKQFLNAYPRISLEFARILSQRIRGRIKPKKIFQCKRL